MIWLEKDSQNVYVCIASSLHTQDRRRKDKLLLLHANQQRNTWSSSWFLPQTYPDISLWRLYLIGHIFNGFLYCTDFWPWAPCGPILKDYISSVSSNCFHVSSNITPNGYTYDTAEISEGCNFHHMVVQSFDGATKKQMFYLGLKFIVRLAIACTILVSFLKNISCKAL